MDFFYPTAKLSRCKIGIGVLLVVGVIYATYTQGYESKHRRYDGGLSSLDNGWSWGGDLMAFQGQTITIDYDIEQLDRGQFHVHVFRPYGPIDSEPLISEFIERTGPGRLEASVEKTGLYHVICDGMVDGSGYDVTYTASWKVQ